ncbi:hypothetical protein [Phreatobacter cathodiphilus]|nr:hypothetical protein [Phreatobacter cathodiphilus]
MATTPKAGTPRPETGRGTAHPDGRTSPGNRGEDRVGGDEVGEGTFADRQAGPEDVIRGAPPKKKKRYSLAD